MALTDDDVREILRIIDESALDELLIETEGFSLHVRKGAASGDAATVAAQRPRAATEAAPPGAAASPSAGASAQSSPAAPSPTGAGSPDAAAAGSADPDSVSAGEAAPSSNGLVEIPSPMLGTFYRAESPGATPFVEVGSRVEPDTTVCIIEVMKMMNSVPAGVAGTVAEVVADNAQLVEFGQPLFRITPDA